MSLLRSCILLLAAIVLTSCSQNTSSAPDLPQSVAPAWSRKTLNKTSADCWRADYASQGTATVSVCRYASTAVALDAAQHSRTEADTVKFQEGNAFVIVKWSNVSQTEITALVRAIQKSLHTN